TACPTLLDQSFGEVGGAGGFACWWKLISIAHPNPENGYALGSRSVGGHQKTSFFWTSAGSALAAWQSLGRMQSGVVPRRRWDRILARVCRQKRVLIEPGRQSARLFGVLCGRWSHMPHYPLHGTSSDVPSSE